MLVVLIILVLLIIVTLYKTAKIVPQKQAWIIERLGEYRETLNAGLHILIPFIDKVAYQRDLKEMALDVPPQQCVTRDNITVTVDGILYLQVVDPVKASYGIQDYLYACSQLAQTTLRSEIDSLRGFVKALYSMMDEDEQYDGPEGMVGGVDFRGINT